MLVLPPTPAFACPSVSVSVSVVTSYCVIAASSIRIAIGGADAPTSHVVAPVIKTRSFQNAEELRVGCGSRVEFSCKSFLIN